MPVIFLSLPSAKRLMLFNFTTTTKTTNISLPSIFNRNSEIIIKRIDLEKRGLWSECMSQIQFLRTRHFSDVTFGLFGANRYHSNRPIDLVTTLGVIVPGVSSLDTK